MTEALDDLLERLGRGDMAAAEQVFLDYEPYLRQVVRRRLSAPLRSKFDSADIVMSAWADVLRGFRDAGWRFLDADHLRSFLFVATRNRLIDRIRQHREAVTREVSLDAGDRQLALCSAQPNPPDLALASDLWRWLLEHCPPEHRPILALRRRGYTLTEIADRIGLHPDSVRRILRTLALRLACERPPARRQRGRK